MFATEKPVFVELSHLLAALARCIEINNTLWISKHNDSIDAIMDGAPSGSGIDNGTALDRDASNGEKLVFITGYHHMNDGGCYDGWTEHKVIVTPSFGGFNLQITGRDRNDIKDHLAQVFDQWLNESAE